MSQWAESVVRARYLVASLGEAASPAWWRTQTTSPVGLRMLARLFPRTFVAAALETASRAARHVHDERIGRIGAYHLFRLPVADEAAIDRLNQPGANVSLQALATLTGQAERLDALARLADGQTAAGTLGPVRCGTLDDLHSGQAIETICAAYIAGFGAGKQVYPYLEDTQP